MHLYRRRIVSWAFFIIDFGIYTWSGRAKEASGGWNTHQPAWDSLCSPGFFKPIHPSLKANLCELVQCCLEFLINEGSLACHVPFPKGPFICQITNSSYATIYLGIPLLRAGAWLVDDGQRWGNLPDALPHSIIYQFCCQAILILPNPHVGCSVLADSNTGILSPNVDLWSWHPDCISICNHLFRQPEGITLRFRFSLVVND